MPTPEQELNDALREYTNAVQTLHEGELTIAKAARLTRAEGVIRALFAARDCGHSCHECIGPDACRDALRP